MSAMIVSGTPIWIVDKVEPTLAFFVDILGFDVLTKVDHEQSLGFAWVQHGMVDAMIQSADSLLHDLPAMADKTGKSILYLRVDSLDDLESKWQDLEVVVPRRTTFYGMHEIVVREPGGHFVILAEPQEPVEEGE